MLETLYLKWFFTKKFEIFEKNDFFTFHKIRSKLCFWSILTSKSEKTSKIGGQGEFGFTKTYFSKNIQKNKNFRKK
jgi:hypothetical protein